MGFGNRYEIRDRRIQHEQTLLRQQQLQDLVIAQVFQSLEEVQRSRERVQITRRGIFDDQGKPNGPVYRSLKLNFTRIRGYQGLPLEVLDSIRRLSDVLEAYGNSMTDFDRARFHLLVALGANPIALLDPRLMPVPRQPIPGLTKNGTKPKSLPPDEPEQKAD
jgi:hypothetical protein